MCLLSKVTSFGMYKEFFGGKKFRHPSANNSNLLHIVTLRD